ncbi:ribonuclease H-like domain-containing protein [Tanacetum coccineum]|uniref:Ribonuclease H-like domain-containing protein n=1 Tax=Tanacetum coccineum TaxID=301880 RepID=A0ABQ5JB49_9ASTR
MDFSHLESKLPPIPELDFSLYILYWKAFSCSLEYGSILFRLSPPPFGFVSMYRRKRDLHCEYLPGPSIGGRSFEPAAMILFQYTWHQSLGHPESEVLQRILSRNSISCTKEKPPVLCHACQFSKHVRLPFVSSNTLVKSCFDVIHSDLWTSPIPSLSGFKYYCDHGGEFDNDAFHKLFADNGIQFRFSCPRTSKQNEKSERMIRTINNSIRTLLFEAHLPPNYWVEALNMAIILLNILPSRAIDNEIPFTLLFGTTPDYSINGVDVDETFGPVVKPGTIQTVLSLAISRHWPVHQLDVKNAFLHSDLAETVYMHQPPGFRDSTHPDYVCLLQRSLYGLKQGSDTAYLLLYVNDIVLTASSEILLQQITASLHQEFSLMDLGSLNYFLGGCNSNRTPVDTESKLSDDGDPVSDPKYFRLWVYIIGFHSYTTSLVAYSDADWAGCPTTRRSTSVYCVFLGNNLLSWSSKRQPTLSRSSAEAEYRGVANVVAETCWLRNLQRELHTPFIDIYFVRDLVTAAQVRVLHVPSRYQFANIFTKGLTSALLEEFRTSLSVQCPPAPTAGEC